MTKTRVLSLVFVVLMICCAFLVNLEVQEPYMDEIFHVPQTQRYCQGELLSWDSKITTPPGFHFLGMIWGVFMSPFAFLLGGTKYCSVVQLRLMNFCLFFVNWWLLGALKWRLNPGQSIDWYFTWSWVTSTHPVYFFFVFLYYTDISSMSLLLSCYLLVLCDRLSLAAISGGIAILIRQTNAIWVTFTLMDAVLRSLHLDLPTQTHGVVYSVFKEIYEALVKGWNRKWNLFKKFWQLILVLMMFGVFVVVNGGIVVGDRTAHQVTIHEAQIPYLFLFILGSLFPLYLQVIPHQKLLGQSIFDKCFLVLFLILFGRFLVFGRIIHPYLVGDNRHINFYLWRWFLSKRNVVCLLIPFAWMSFLVTSILLAKHRSHLWILGFYFCSILTILPSPLFELRYFLPMTILMALHVPPMRQQGVALVVIGVMYSLLNGFMLYLFLARSYIGDDGTEARFIW